MFLQFTGISLLIHLAIIGCASVLNIIHKTHHRSAFQTYNKQGGVVRNELVNRILSLLILVFMATYMIGLFALAITTALRLGENGPQMVFYSFVGTLVTAFFLYFFTHVYLSALFVVVGTMLFLARNPTNRAFLQKKYVRLHNQVEVIVAFLFFTIGFYVLYLIQITREYTQALLVLGLRYIIIPTQDILRLSFRNGLTSVFGVFSTIQKRSLWFFVGLIVGAGTLMIPNIVSAQIVEPGFESEVVAEGFSLATAVAFTEDGRIFVAEKSGTIKVVKNGTLLPEPLITLTDVNTFGDRGLLGLAVDPNFTQNGYIYVSYTYENSPGLNIAGPKTGRIVRLTVVGDTADESSKFVLVGSVGGSALTPSCEDFAVTDDCIASDSNSHSVGGLRFGPDGKLYATLGDGADFVDVDPRALRAQDVDALSGKMLRINTDGTAPTDNPFYNGNVNANRSKVFALGFRNSFRFNFNPTSGALYAGDVGWSDWEEVNRIVAGGNYGWPCREGNNATSYGCSPSTSATNPLYTYQHNSSGAGSITGGAFFSNSAYPTEYATSFFIGDYAQMWMKRLVLNTAGTAVVSVEDFIPEDVWPVDVLTGADGNVYYLDIVFGSLNRLTHTSGNRRPVVSVSATPNSGLVPLSASFSSVGTYDPDADELTYAWDFGDGATSMLANPSHVYTTNGTFDASVSVSDIHGATVAKSVTITAGNQTPEATITTPSSGSLYAELEQITVTGIGVDPELGTLPASAFSWDVVLHHNVHTHTIQQFTNTKTITFTADDHNASDVYLEIVLTVTDSAGLTDSKSINMYLDNGIGSGNLVSNPSFEIEGALPGSPLNWYQGWYGVLNPIFTYPVAGFAGANAASLELTSYSSGNAKWYFSPAYVTAGEEYHFSNLYTATVPTNLTAQFGLGDGTYQYQTLIALAPTSTPTRTNIDFTIPAGIETVSIFHEIDQVGILTVDDYSLILAPNGIDVTPPTGAITSPTASAVVSGIVPVIIDANDDVGVGSVHLLVDGVEVGVGDSEAPFSISWDSTSVTDGSHNLSAHIHDTSGNEVESAVVAVTVTNTVATPVNLITNGDFEIANGALPLGWVKGGWGSHTRVHTYPVAGSDGGVGAEVAITQYSFSDTGDAKWQFNDVPVTPGTQYTYESMYKATSISDVIGRYTRSNGTVHYFGLIKELPAVSNWTHIQNTFVPPADAVSVTFLHLISSVAVLSIDEVEMYVSGSGTPAETNAPFVAFLNPLPNSTVSGTVTLTASSSDDTSVVGVYFAVNGIFQGVEDISSPYQTTWNSTLVPDGTYVLKATSHDPYGNNDKAEITVTVNNTTPPTDTTLPTVSVIAPTAGTATGTVSVQVTATDNVAVAGVTLLIDGAIVGTQDTTSPYTFSWNTTSLTNGAHTVSARAVDTAGNSKDATTIPVTVNNVVVPPTGNNLVINPALEINGTGGNPANWNRGGWGTNNRTYTYPVAGLTGNAAQVEITTYTNGDAKWYFDPVTVTPDTQYTVGDKYNSTVPSEILARYTLTSGAFSYQFLSQLPATGGSWNTFSQAITTPANATALTLFHVIASNGRLTVDDASVLGETIATPDTTLPTVNVTSPASGATASGTTSVQVTATDNIGLTGVTLLVDGAVVGTQDTTSPYTFSWDSTTVANGAHTISARAVDTSNNIADATAVSVIVSNVTVPPPTGNNLVLNPALETNGTGGNPANWNRGGWGTNNRVFTYPVAGVTGNAAQVEITTYTNGDAKWYFDPVTVVPGEQYTFSYAYKSSVTTNISIRYTMTDGSFTYVGLANPSASAGWTTGTLTFVPPTGAVSATVMQILNKAGTLTVDNHSLSSGNIHTFNRGKVTFSFDDGWLEHYTIALPALDSAGIDGTFYIITDEMADATPTERVPNSSLETDGTAGNPASWNKGGWGTNDRILNYPVAGATGDGAEVVITSYTNGDAKWYFDPVNVIPDTKYVVGDKYKSTVPTEILARYTLTDGAFLYQFLSQLPATSGSWNTFSQTITTPVNATSLTLFHVIAGVGTLAIDDVSVQTIQVYANQQQVEELQASGHEIGAHTKTHPDLTTLSTSAMTSQIAGSRQVLQNAGFTVSTIAYPYGAYNEEVQTITAEAGYTLGRSVDRGYNNDATDPYALKIQQVSREDTFAEMTGWIDQAEQDKTWVIFMFHQISDNATETLGITESNFQALVDYLSTADVDVITVAEGAPLLQ